MLQCAAAVLCSGLLLPSHALQAQADAHQEDVVGLQFERSGQAGFVHLQIVDHAFRVTFLDAQKQPEVDNKVVEVIVQAEAIEGDRDREVYYLDKVKNEPFYETDRFIEAPYIYNVKLLVKSKQRVRSYSKRSGYRQKIIMRSYGFTILNQLVE